MKVGIWDGCANGGLMDSLNIDALTGDPAQDGQPVSTVEISEEKWKEWEAFLKLHEQWERFWDKALIEGSKQRRNKKERI